MTIKIGDKMPDGVFKIMKADGPGAYSAKELFTGKKVVLFSVPGAFTPTCSKQHLPGFIDHAGDLNKKGIDTIACMAVNDVFVMGAWGKSQNAEELLMVGDGNGTFTKAVGLELDATGFGMGTRSKRYAMIVDNGVVTHLAVEPAGGIVDSAAEAILAKL